MKNSLKGPKILSPFWFTDWKKKRESHIYSLPRENREFKTTLTTLNTSAGLWKQSIWINYRHQCPGHSFILFSFSCIQSPHTCRLTKITKIQFCLVSLTLHIPPLQTTQPLSPTYFRFWAGGWMSYRTNILPEPLSCLNRDRVVAALVWPKK